MQTSLGPKQINFGRLLLIYVLPFILIYCDPGLVLKIKTVDINFDSILKSDGGITHISLNGLDLKIGSVAWGFPSKDMKSKKITFGIELKSQKSFKVDFSKSVVSDASNQLMYPDLNSYFRKDNMYIQNKEYEIGLVFMSDVCCINFPVFLKLPDFIFVDNGDTLHLTELEIFP